MDPNRRYKVKAPDAERYRQVCQILTDNAEVLVTNEKRHTVSATRIDDTTEDRLRSLEVVITEEYQYDLE